MLLRVSCLVVLLVGSSCASHTRDDGGPEPTDAAHPQVDAALPEGDAGVEADASIDAGPPSMPSVWRRVDNYGGLRELTSGCGVAPGGHRIFEVASSLDDDCGHASPPRVEWLDDHRVRITPTLWRENLREPRMECMGLNAQALSVVSLAMPLDGAALTVEIGVEETVVEANAAAAECSAGGALDAACEQSCDCEADLVCIPTVSPDFRLCRDTPGRCGRPCSTDSLSNPRFGCPSGEACVRAGNAAAPRCIPDGDYCSPSTQVEDTCEAGLACSDAPGDCTWAADPGIGAPCDACGGAMDCVEDKSGSRACAVRCATDTWRCPAGFACGESGTCEPS